ncbi:LysE family translocator [Acinetobacter sp. WZC-1]|uniref:LysE family translocator n=1 Tax=Acinetobacter sp. WZC-1 TaxID=3459034 RepID=UPI00403DBDD3
MFLNHGHEFLALALVHFMAVVLPGPDFAVTVRQSVRYGYVTGCVTALGIGIGISVHVLYTLIGLGIVIQKTPWLMSALSTCGALYLLYLGWCLIRSKAMDPALLTTERQAVQRPALWQAFMTGFLTNALNPKATIFFLAIFTTLVSPATPLKIQALYGLWMCMVNALWFILVSLLFSRLWVRQTFLKLGHCFESVMGLVLIAIACKLLFSAFLLYRISMSV